MATTAAAPPPPPAGPVAITPKTVGIIYPPPDLRSIVDKTATFVARNGDEFEKKIMDTQASNPKFSFMRSTDPYHAYYRAKIRDIREGRAAPADQPPAATAAAAAAQPAAAPAAAATTAAPTTTVDAKAATVSAQPVRATKKPAPTTAPPPLDFLAPTPENLTALDLDIMKLTAQFVARSGKSFLTGITTREMRNPQFDFLKPQHSLFAYFQHLVEAYTRIMNPPKALMDRIHTTDFNTVLERTVYRAEWDRVQAEEKQKAQDMQDKERMQMQTIDWYDFSIVETINFTAEEEHTLPPPMSEEDLKLLSRAVAAEFSDDSAALPSVSMDTSMNMDMDMDMDMDAEAPAAAPVPTVEVVADEDREIKIVRNYQPAIAPTSTRAAESAAVRYQICPRCKQQIPVEEMEQHMKIELLHPDYIEQKKKQAQQPQVTPFAHNLDISSNLKQFAQRRTDLFGNDEETEMGRTITGEAQKPATESVVWDGHSGSAARVAEAAKAMPVSEAPAAAPKIGPPLPALLPQPGPPGAPASMAPPRPPVPPLLAAG